MGFACGPNPQFDALYDGGMTGHQARGGQTKQGSQTVWRSEEVRVRPQRGHHEKTPLGKAPAGFLSGRQSLCGDQKLYFTPNTAPRSPKYLPSKELL